MNIACLHLRRLEGIVKGVNDRHSGGIGYPAVGGRIARPGVPLSPETQQTKLDKGQAGIAIVSIPKCRNKVFQSRHQIVISVVGTQSHSVEIGAAPRCHFHVVGLLRQEWRRVRLVGSLDAGIVQIKAQYGVLASGGRGACKRGSISVSNPGNDDMPSIMSDNPT